jgi:hypothetical protein
MSSKQRLLSVQDELSCLERSIDVEKQMHPTSSHLMESNAPMDQTRSISTRRGITFRSNQSVAVHSSEYSKNSITHLSAFLDIESGSNATIITSLFHCAQQNELIEQETCSRNTETRFYCRCDRLSSIDSFDQIDLVTAHFGLANELGRLIELGWYWGHVNRAVSEQLLSPQIPGTFLIRDSHDALHLLSISFKSEFGVFHTRIERRNGRYRIALGPSRLYASIIDLLHQTIQRAHSGHFLYTTTRSQSHVFPVGLLFPLRVPIDFDAFDRQSRHSQ